MEIKKHHFPPIRALIKNEYDSLFVNYPYVMNTLTVLFSAGKEWRFIREGYEMVAY